MTRARRRTLRLALAFLPSLMVGGALAQEVNRLDPPLSAEEFDRLTRGKVMDTHDASSGLYGVEKFMSGRRVLWADGERCVEGTWEQVGEQICFTYEDREENPVCWTYHDRGNWIMGWYEGNRDHVPIMLYPSEEDLQCKPFVGA